MDIAQTQGVIVNRPEKHRNFLRFPLRLPATCLLSVEAPPAQCWIVDISEHGLGLEIDAPVRIHRGQCILLKIDSDLLHQPIRAMTELTWVRRRKNGSQFQRVGSRLVSINQDEKQLLLECAYDSVLSSITERAIA